jgi:hypothetical protein
MDTPALPVRVLVVGRTGGRVVRVGRLTPDFTKTIAQDALKGQGAAEVEVVMPTTVSEHVMDCLRDELHEQLSRGTRVSVRRSGI